MKPVLLLVLIAVLSPLSLLGQFSLRIEIEGLRSSNGQVILVLSSEKGEKISGVFREIEESKSVIVLENLKPGNYSFKYFHDENKNQVLDLNRVGIPKEGFGYANNAKGTFGPPSFKKTIFALTGDKTLKCTPTYY
ncbi:MAG: hypothetical protein CVU13_04730 [Bacteroidetes bacterium HGW-Bacteroidetes-8]|jgi:uncharacterized protein (DUF2141 family)|nr:MAG: hypothetical protein CVU13_04730 [Bacteroidetes bacterium HGW-Bacteroidetes-8]